MDTSFTAAEWNETLPEEIKAFTVNPNEVTGLITDLTSQTKSIIQHPYNPETWMKRAVTLQSLGYRELALGDGMKCGLLCDLILKHMESEDRKGYRLGFVCGFWMYDPTSHVSDDARDELYQRIKRLQSIAETIERITLDPLQEYERGTYIPRPYPWLSPSHRTRSHDLISELNYVLAARAPEDSKPSGPLLTIRRHAFGTNTSNPSLTANMLGIFATRSIPAQTAILIDHTRIFGCNAPRTNTNNRTVSGCDSFFHPNLPGDSTAHDLRWLRARAGPRAADVLVRARFLLDCVASGPSLSHPLSHPQLASLTPFYKPNRAQTLSREEDIILPTLYLQQLGIDIFADLRYDTWVLFTIRARIANNSCGDAVHSAVHPLFSLFNHSCAPNAAWTLQDPVTTLVVRTERAVEAGEQFFVEYDGFVHGKKVGVRRERLRDWLEGDCGCGRCVREVEKGEVVVERGVWDVGEKVVFPEDGDLQVGEGELF